jgi:ActR/RegA family two-component response regulator
VLVRIVEDDPFIASMLELALPRYGIVPAVTAHGFERLLAPGPWVGVEAAVVDFMLGPGSIGGDVILTWLKENRPDIRRVLFSAVGGLGGARGVDLADVAVTKPTDIEALVEAIRG